MKNRDLVNLLNRAAAVIENPDSEIRSHREQLVEDLLAVARSERPQPDANEIQTPARSATEATPAIMYDWRLADAPEPNIDPRPWKVEIKEATEARFVIVATCPDGTERQVWIEIQAGRLVIHAYDPEHEEPVNLRIGTTGITVDSDRGGRYLEHFDLKHCDAMEEFARQMASMSLPEEEWKDAGYADVDKYVSDLDDERLCGEYDTFMDMVRTAREIVK